MTLGTDFSGGSELDWSLSEASGRLALGQCIVRRLSTESGSLRDFPEYGYDLTQLIGSAVADVAVIEEKVLEQCYQEEEVLFAEVKVTIIKPTTISIKVILQDADGPFQLTIDVSDLNVSAIIPS